MILLKRSMVLVDLRSTVHDYFGTSGLPIILLQRSTVPIDLRSMVQNYFGSLGFRSFSFLLMRFFEVSNSQSVRPGAVCPLVLDDRDLLREFGLRSFFSCLLVQFSEV